MPFSVEERVATSLAAGANLRDMCLGRFGREQGGAGQHTPFCQQDPVR